MEKEIDYSDKNLDYKTIFLEEEKRQNKTGKELDNVKVKLNCPICNKKYRKFLFDPTLKTPFCSEKCSEQARMEDIFNENSSKLVHECMICGKLFSDTSRTDGSMESSEVNRDVLVCSEACKISYKKIFG